MSGGGKGGSQKTSVKIPEWLEDAARRNMARADELAQIGYVPYYGPDVAAFSPMQMAAFQSTGDAASAFGMAAPADPMAGVPAPQVFAGGVQGYSSAPMFEQSLAALEAARPGQFAAMQAPFIDPVTGAEPSSPFGSGGAGMGGGKGGGGRGRGGGAPMRSGSSDRMWSDGMTTSQITAAQRAGTFGAAPRTSGGSSGSGTGSFGLPDPTRGSFSGTNLPGIGGSVINAITRR